MISVKVKADTKRLNRLREKLGKNQVATILSKSINSTLADARKKAIQAVESTYNIPRASLETITVKESTSSKPEGYISASGKPLPLILFDPLDSKDNGVSFEVLKGRRSRIPFAFMTSRSKHVLARGTYRFRTPFGFVLGKQRNKKNRSEISVLLTVSVKGAMENPKNRAPVDEFIKNNLSKRITAALKQQINKV